LVSLRETQAGSDRESGAYLLKFSWTKIVRHQLVRGRASPDDPDLAQYWSRRRQRKTPPLDGVSLRQLKAQHGGCPLCGAPLLLADHEPQTPEEWEQWLTVIRKAVRRDAITTERNTGTPDKPVAFHLVHADCRRRSHTAVGTVATVSAHL
jgi:RNA-directed DNA polymerase